MKIFVTTILLLITANCLYAQSAGEQLSDKIATKMKDSLDLSIGQRGQVFAVNMQLHNQKMAIRQQYSNPDSLRAKLQRVEGMRDSLYKQVLTNEQYMLYRQKKSVLVNNN